MCSGDLIYANVSCSHPLLELPSFSAAALPLFANIDDDQGLNLSADTVLSLDSFRTEIEVLIRLITKLDALRSTSYSVLTSSTANMVTFSEHCFAIECRLLSITTSLQINRLDSADDRVNFLISDALRIASALCMTYLFRNMSLRGKTFSGLQKSLRDCLRRLELLHEHIFSSYSETRRLLWTCCVGGIASVDSSELIIIIHRCMSAAGVETWQELNKILEGFIWGFSMCLDFQEKIWPKLRSLGITNS